MIPTPPPLGALAAYLGVVAIERAVELAISARHARQLAARGAVEFGREHFKAFVALHALAPLALVFEVVWLGARPPATWGLWLGLWLGAQALRSWALASLGTFWNVRVWVLPGATPIARGPYRWLRHPNYLAVVIEFVAGPLMFGAWRTALLGSVLDAVALAVRIPVEERALEWAARTSLSGR